MQTFDIKVINPAIEAANIDNDTLMIIKLYKAGLTFSEIAEVSGKTVNMLSCITKKYNINKHFRDKYNTEKDRVKDLYMLGVSRELICKRYNIDIDTVNDIVGIPEPLTFSTTSAKIGEALYERDKEIRQMYADGELMNVIGKKFGLTRQRIGQIVRSYQ